MLDRFHLTLDQYARLTDRQIFELYLHPRKEDGSIDPDPPPPSPTEKEQEQGQREEATLEREMAILDQLALFTFSEGGRSANLQLIDSAKLPELKAKLKAKYGCTP